MHAFYWEERTMVGRWTPVAGSRKPAVKKGRLDLVSSSGPEVRNVQPVDPALQNATLADLARAYGTEEANEAR